VRQVSFGTLKKRNINKKKGKKKKKKEGSKKL